MDDEDKVSDSENPIVDKVRLRYVTHPLSPPSGLQSHHDATAKTQHCYLYSYDQEVRTSSDLLKDPQDWETQLLSHVASLLSCWVVVCRHRSS